MEIGVFLSGCRVMVSLIADDASQAALLRDHISKGAPPGVTVSRNGNVVSVLQAFESEEQAEDWAREIKQGMDEGFLFNLEIGGASEISRT